MKIIISNSSDLPIYEQIYRQIKASIIKGVVKDGEALPSIRGLAKDLQISVITTKRAYEELEKEGLIDTIPGKGSYVAPQDPELMRESKLRVIENKLSEVVRDSKVFGISYEEVVEILDILYEEV